MVKQKKTTNLSEKAMLVNLTLSQWTGRVKDKKVSNEVCAVKESDGDAGAWWTYLVPKRAIAQVGKTRMNCYMKHVNLTLPWMDGGLRILSSDMFMRYSEEMRKAISEYDEAVNDFLKEYLTIVAQAEKRLGKLLEGKQFPSASEIKYKFAVHQDILPIPQASDFRCQLNADEVIDIRKNIATSIETMAEKAMSTLWERFTILVDKVEKTMKKPKKIFRDSLISNLKDFCELIPKMNLTNDNNLEELRREVAEKLAQLKLLDLRESKRDRRKAHKSAKKIMEKIKGYTN